MAKILLVDDDEELRSVVRTFLLFEHHTVETLADGREAANHLKTYDYDLVILDWQMPGASGIDVLHEFRGRGGKTPILMLTGKDRIENKEESLDSGADDYLTKPFDIRELGARVRALLRRPAPVADSGTILSAGNISMDVSKHRVTVDGKTVELVPKEFQLLEFMLRHPSQVFTPEGLLNRVWASDSESTIEALRTTVKRLRKKVDPDGAIFRTVHGVGYILELS